MTNTFQLSLHVVRRNWTVYKKDFFANIAPTISDPALYILSLGLGLGSMVAEIDGHSYKEFIAPGLMISTALFTAFFETSYGFYVRMTFENIYKAMLTTPISAKEVVFGEFMWVSIKGALMSLGVAIVLALFGLMPRWDLIFLVPLVGALVALPCGAMGLLASALVRNINQFQTTYAFLIAPLFFFSGVFFPIEKMPEVVRLIGDLFPVIHGVRLAQAVFWGKEVMMAFFVHGSLLLFQSLIFGWLAWKKIRPKLIS